MRLNGLSGLLVAVAAGCTTPNPDSCVVTKTLCSGATVCNSRTGRCESTIAGDGGLDGGDAGREAGADLMPDQPAPIGLMITKPSAAVYANGVVTFELALTGPAPDKVELLRGTELVTTLVAPYRYDWDTKTVPEGPHALVARSTRGSQVVTTAPVLVTVDRTPPQLVSQAPLPNAANVSLFDPIELKFSEPLAETAATPGSVVLAAGTSTLVTTKRLSEDRTTIRVEVSERSGIPLPATVTATTSVAVTDLAGNFAPPTSWAWTFPVWLDVGFPMQAGRRPSIAYQGDKVAVTSIASAPENVPVLAAFVDGRWRRFGSARAEQVATDGAAPVVFDKAGNAVVAYSSRDTAGNPAALVSRFIFAETRWDTSYLPYGGKEVPGLAMDRYDRVVVANFYEAGPQYPFAVHVGRWNPETLSWDGGPVGSGHSVQVVVRPDNEDVVLRTSSGTAIVAVAKTSGYDEYPVPMTVYRPQLAMAGTRGPFIVGTAGRKAVVLSLTSAGTWQNYVADADLSGTPVEVRVAFDIHGSPTLLVSYLEVPSRNQVFYWRGTAWEAGPQLTGLINNPVVGLDALGRAIVAYDDNARILVTKSNR